MISNSYSMRLGSKENLMAMVKILSKETFGLKVCHINAQSLNNKMDEFQLVFEDSNIDIICVSETWFNPSVDSFGYNLSGYRLFRSDRATNGGGVAIYVKSTIRCGEKARNPIGSEIEYVLVEICNDNEKLLVSAIYRPNKYINVECFLDVLSTSTLGYNHIILTGDFNSNIFEDNSLQENMNAIGLYLVNDRLPTHFTSTSSTLIDLCFTNNKSHLLFFDQLSASMFSRHDLLFISYNFMINNNNTTPKTFEYRDFRNIDIQSLTEELLLTNWNIVFYMPNVDEQLNFFNDKVRHLYDKYVPIKTKIVRSGKPWFTSEIKNLIDVRNRAYKRWKNFRTPQLYDMFKTARAAVNKKIRIAKTIFYNNKLQSSIDSGKKWREIHKMGIIKRNDPVSNMIDVNQLNRQFANIHMPSINIDFYRNLNNNNREHVRFDFRHFTQDDVVASILSIKSNAVGFDGMHPKFIKLILPNTILYLTHIFNTILTTSTFPRSWKYAKIIPIEKPDKSYRPIAILPYLSKVFEKLLHSQISSYLYLNSMLNERQSGFRPKHSCLTALADTTEEIRCQIDERRKMSFLILLDHSKAFDTVDHSILCLKLKNMCSFSSTALKLLTSYLSERRQSVCFESNVSESCLMPRGVPQGSILGPLLYSIYANDLPSQLNHCKIQMYADDVQLYIGCNIVDAPKCVRWINQDLQQIYLWASANGLSLNPKKSVAMTIGSSKSIPPNLPPITINNETINFVEKAKNLGVTFNKQLNWSDHVGANSGKTFAMLRNLWISRHYTPYHIRLLIAKTYLLPTLMYGCELFASCDAVSRRKLNVTYNNIARYIFGIKRYMRISQYAKRIYSINFDNLLKCRVLLFLHKIIYTGQPGYLFNRLTFSRSNRGNNINTIGYNKAISEQHFFINAIRLWSRLPPRIQILSNTRQFKTEIFKYFA